MTGPFDHDRPGAPGADGDESRPADWVDEAAVFARPDSRDAPAAELYVERVGRANAPTVYFLHGGPGYSSYSFRELMGDDLEDFDVIYADQRGGGRSLGDASVDTTVLAHDVIAVIDALEVGSATLLAHGFGAAVAVRTAALRPDVVDRVILVNPWLSLPLLAATLNAAAKSIAAGTDLAQLEDGETLQELDDPLETTVPDDPRHLVDEAFALVNPKVLFDAMQFPTAAGRLRLEHVDAVALSGDVTDEAPDAVWSIDELQALGELEAAGVPVVVLSGNRDHTSYPVQAEQALLRSPSALFSLLEGGHYPWIDDAESFTQVLLAALIPTSEGG